MISIDCFYYIADLICSQIKCSLFKSIIIGAFSKRIRGILIFIIFCYQWWEILSCPGAAARLLRPLVSLLLRLCTVGNSLSILIEGIGLDQNILHSDSPCLIITDLRVDVGNQVFIDLASQGIFFIHLLYQLLIDSKYFYLSWRQRFIILCCCPCRLIQFFSIQRNFFLLCQKIHCLDLRHSCQYCLFYIIFQCLTLIGSLPYSVAIHGFILVLHIGQIHHDLRESAG